MISLAGWKLFISENLPYIARHMIPKPSRKCHFFVLVCLFGTLNLFEEEMNDSSALSTLIVLSYLSLLSPCQSHKKKITPRRRFTIVLQSRSLIFVLFSRPFVVLPLIVVVVLGADGAGYK